MADEIPNRESNGADEALRRDILDVLLGDAAFDGFTDQALTKAARTAGLGQDEIASGTVQRLFPRGVADALALWSETEDAAMVAAFEALNPKPHGITKRITWLVRQRIEQLDWNREAARRAGSTLALPIHGRLGAKLLFQTADTMWRAIDDKSTDFNWYTKRATLSAIYTATLSHWFATQGDAAAEDPYAETWAFLDARMGNLMQFEKFKAQVQKVTPDPVSIVNFLGRIRYGSGSSAS
ncbi:MAG: COQ9 family protein [Pseudomonadota bacterium]